MARRPNVVCAGQCGVLMWSGTGSLPPGEAKCRACRAATLRDPCKHCGNPITGSGRDFCSRACASQHAVRRTDGEKLELARARWQKRRATVRAAASEFYTRQEIGDRDLWTCGICAGPVTAHLQWPDPLSPSVDHIRPLSMGGDNTRANVRIAHLVCNVRRGNRAVA